MSDLFGGPTMSKATCTIGGCPRSVHGHGYCNRHYYRLINHGDPLGGEPFRYPWPINLLLGFDLAPSGCWMFRRTNDSGYGPVLAPEGHRRAHRKMYEFVIGPIPEGKVLDHICHDPDVCQPEREEDCPHRACCNPWHMKVVTQKENNLRSNSPSALNARKTHCKRGHPFDTENTRWTKTGGRQCRKCDRIREGRSRP